MALTVGSCIANYDVTALIGEGGMGQVYQAHDPTLQRTVAIKVLAKQDSDASTRLLQEARAASALNHPHICTIYQVGEHEGQAFVVMEHVEGKPLSALIPADGLPPESVIRHGMQIADALAHAHERGIVHRDLKSQNVVVTPEGWTRRWPRRTSRVPGSPSLIISIGIEPIITSPEPWSLHRTRLMFIRATPCTLHWSGAGSTRPLLRANARSRSSRCRKATIPGSESFSPLLTGILSRSTGCFRR